ncbi:hypothetical protein E0H39_29790 [Rhizobium leguminosarum bv. viciae]|uniref:hypothetical protein n=1 Tax=Rhizobium leguminosarum TaxID=384 RepID=UPI00103A8FD8|nr:hypothetical protein [Rhizobium leguminosarum]NKL63324.1 hypothetical protein [Rhizobium leguminosarum bv. viciae]TBY57700.1 hypothetical protein E0H39_29790 [Rhizobium leguminosarum bv. viciae]
MKPVSTHYFFVPKRGSKVSRRDALRGRVEEALRVLAAVAAEDADFAKAQNGRGFSKSDQEGHALSKLSVEQALVDELLTMKVLGMGRRYSRQASTISQLSLL